MPKTQKASVQTQLDENRRLTFESFEEQSDLSGETLVAQVQIKKGDNWETVAKIKLNRTPDGTYKQLSENK